MGRLEGKPRPGWYVPRWRGSGVRLAIRSLRVFALAKSRVRIRTCYLHPELFPLRCQRQATLKSGFAHSMNCSVLTMPIIQTRLPSCLTRTEGSQCALPDSRRRPKSCLTGWTKEAAKILLDWMDQGGGGNYAFYPMVFLLRHCVELELKEDIVGLHALKGSTDSVPGWVWRQHSLSRLAQEVEDGMVANDLPFDESWTRVKSTLCLWERADPGGMFFRFSRDNDGKAVPLPEGLTSNPKNLRAGRIAREGIYAIDWLDGLRSEIGEALQVQGEMREEHGP
jgi:hypothetical protein